MDQKVDIKEEPLWLEGAGSTNFEHVELEPATTSLKEETKQESTEPGPSQHAADIKVEITIEEHIMEQRVSHIKEESSLDSDAVLATGQLHSCEVCSKTFTRISDLKSHLLTHTEGPKYCGDCSVVCSVCNRKFSKRSSLKTHMLSHSKERPHSCTLCSSKFFQRAHMKAHMVSHSNERPHSCVVCGCKFSLKDTLKRHMLTHSNERPHCCTLCSRTFTHKHALKSHMSTHSNERPHSCSLCSRKFSRKSNMQAHMLTHSREKIPL